MGYLHSLRCTGYRVSPYWNDDLVLSRIVLGSGTLSVTFSVLYNFHFFSNFSCLQQAQLAVKNFECCYCNLSAMPLVSLH